MDVVSDGWKTTACVEVGLL
ncbi:Protein of unknown function [Pyronema omphalodes CBS 100304]|uniref:Uncharacterized protein n=1 Tax=Pyronema omphalodes (strain CBS 100304) TaxID=1076935 RepID=U4LH21_PYROM|nr:Protein of unknown function [Pyronema omphalodes CBS 100304]